MDVAVSVALNAHHFDGEAPRAAAAWAPFDGAHWSRPAVEGTQDFTYYGQQVSRLTPAGGPTAGGTRVLVSGAGFDGFGGRPAACRFGDRPTAATASGDLPADAISSLECVVPGGAPGGGWGPPSDAVGGGDVPFGLALNYATYGCGLTWWTEECSAARFPTGLAFRGSFRPPAAGALTPPYSRNVSEGQRPASPPPVALPREAAPPLTFTLYRPPVVSSVFPARGDHRGGVALVVRGAHFHHDVTASPLLCGFDLAGATPHPPDASTTPATFLNATAIACTSPPRATFGSSSAVSVALNGHDFEGGNAFEFEFVAPLVASHHFPLAGPVVGGAEVRVLGSGLRNGTGVRCLFGAHASDGRLVPLERSEVEGARRMGVGANASAAGATHVHACTAPSAHLAGASGVIRRDFDDEGAFALLGDELRGTARLDRGALLLTEGVNLATFTPRNAYGKNGQWPLWQPVGSLILNRGQRGRGGGGAPAATIRQFDASFELQVGGGGAHDGKSLEGLSFSLGPLREGRAEHIEMYADLRGGGRPRTIGIDPENRRVPDASEWTEWDLDAPIGGEGLWRGLNIEMEYSMGANFDMANSHFDWTNPPLPKTAMRVRYEQEIVYEAFVDQALVTRTWANVTVRLDAHGLTVTHNGRLYVEELPIFGWAPRPHWQFTLGASTHGLGRFFRVDNLRIRSGDLLQSGAVPMAIAINGQDYAPVPGGFAYFTPVRASGVSPTAGPVHGHTRLSVSGSLLAPAPQLECRVQGATVAATRAADGHIVCFTPNATTTNDAAHYAAGLAGGAAPVLAPEASTPLRLSLDGQTFTPAADVRFRLYPQPNVSRLLPWTGPAAGGTVVAIACGGCGDGGEPVGVDYRCRFGNGAKVVATVAGSYDVYRDRLICVAPNVGRPQAAPLELTLNGQQYTESGVIFAHRAPLVVTAVEPPRGPALGRTTALVRFDAPGQAGGGGEKVSTTHDGAQTFEDLRCRFGVAKPTRPVQHSDTWALCVSPPSYETGAAAFAHTVEFGTDAPRPSSGGPWPFTSETRRRRSTVADGAIKVDVYGDARIEGGVLRLTDYLDDPMYIPYDDDGGHFTQGVGHGSAIFTLRRPYNPSTGLSCRSTR